MSDFFWESDFFCELVDAASSRSDPERPDHGGCFRGRFVSASADDVRELSEGEGDERPVLLPGPSPSALNAKGSGSCRDRCLLPRSFTSGESAASSSVVRGLWPAMGMWGDVLCARSIDCSAWLARAALGGDQTTGAGRAAAAPGVRAVVDSDLDDAACVPGCATANLFGGGAAKLLALAAAAAASRSPVCRCIPVCPEQRTSSEEVQ